jgi:hypothetical protein
MDHLMMNSMPLQFIKFVHDTDPLGADSLLDVDFAEIHTKFNTWRLRELNEVDAWPEPDVLNAFRPVLLTERKSKRVNGTPRKIRQVVSFTKETRRLLDSLKEEEADATTVVDN